jgi:hypothetical protein
LAGYEEPRTDATKQQRVLNAIQNADEETAKRIVEELLNVLRPGGMFDTSRVGTVPADVESLKIAFERRGFKLAEGGYADWASQAQQQPPSAKTTPTTEPTVEIEVVTIPGIGLLVSSLRRLAFALRPLVQRRRGRDGLTIKDEYDLQDLVESLLKSLYSDVRAEERTPSYAGASSVMDFLLKDEAVAVEVKVTAPGRLPKHIKNELLVDINDYQQHPSVRTLIAVVYDLASTFDNPTGFERDLTGWHRNIEVIVLVVGWPLPPIEYPA